MLLEKLTLLLEEKGYLKNPETGKIEPGSLDAALKQYFDKILKDLNKEDLDEVVQDKSQYEKYLEEIIEYASGTYSGEPVIDYIKNNKSRLITRLMSVDALSESMNEQEEDPVDTITMDVPLFIRILEYSREDAENDMDLHDVAEKAIAGTKQQGILSMDDYDMLIGDSEQMNTSEIAKEIYETIQLGHQLDESTLCKRGQEYIKARKAAGEKSSAYLSGRAVKVCKGQIKFKGKKRKDFKG